MPKKFSKEFKAEAVRLVLEEEMTQAEVAADLGVSDTSIGRWVAQARVDAGKGPDGALTTDEKSELRELRRRVRRLEMEKEILKKAAAFFAKESL
jgi:transposase